MSVLRKFFLAVFILSQFYSVPAQVPAPPEINSEEGYLQVVSDIEIPPGIQRIFIIPQTKLPILEETESFYTFLFEKKHESVCCFVPKYAKFMVLTSPSEDGKSVYFRGSIEADTIPFKIKKGEELPVLNRTNDGYFASVKRAGRNVSVFIPMKTEGFIFSKESLFAKFAAEQKKKGLEYLDGKWASAEEAEILWNSQKSETERQERRWNDLKAGAEGGVIVLKDGRILHGTFKGSDGSQILFESEDRIYQVALNDAADLDFKNITAAGLLDLAGQGVERAGRIGAGDPGEAEKWAERALKYLEKIDKSTPEKFEQALSLAGDAKKILGQIDEYLKKNGLSIYDYKVFPKEVLDYHLQKKHMLLGENSWIEADQLCKKCNGAGTMTCPSCQASGKIKGKCENCDNGRVACHICGGSGGKDCPVCNGNGSLYKKCTKCEGSGYISGLWPYPSRSGSKVAVVDGSVTVISRLPYFYPCYTTQICPVCSGCGKMETDCLNCGGKGKISCPQTEKCNLCNGIGHTYKICPDCAGKGKIICSGCGEKGFTGNPQFMPETAVPPNKGTLSVPALNSQIMAP